MEGPIIISVGLALVVGVFFMFVSLQRNKLRARIEAVEARGWRYTAQGSGYLIEGEANGIPWTLKLKRSGGANDSGKNTVTLWEAPAQPIDQVVLLGPKLPPMLAKLNFGGSMVQMVLRFLLGEDGKDMVGVTEMAGVGSAAFQSTFTVLATTKACAEELVVPEVEASLVAAQAQLGKAPVVLRWRDRLQLRHLDGAYQIDQIEAMVGLGVALAERAGFGTDGPQGETSAPEL